jgi:hypothetical protein
MVIVADVETQLLLGCGDALCLDRRHRDPEDGQYAE